MTRKTDDPITFDLNANKQGNMKMNVQSEVKTADNGVNVQALLDARAALSQSPDAAQFTWRAVTEWQSGVYNRSTIEGFYGLGDEHAHRKAFTIDADHPAEFAAPDNGPTPVEIVVADGGSIVLHLAHQLHL